MNELPFRDAESEPSPHNAPPAADASSRQQSREHKFNLHIEDADDPVEEAPEAPAESPKLKDIHLPDALQRRVAKQYVTAILIALFTLAMAVYYKRAELVVGFAISGALVYFGISTKFDFAEGKIVELPVTCASSTSAFARKTTRVVFRTQDEENPQFFEFVVPGKHAKNYTPNFTYVIYFRRDKPKELLAAIQI